jgi:hypothetical protein
MAEGNECQCNNGHYVFSSLWKEHLYLETQSTAQDQRFFNNALKSAHIEGKMSAREIQYTRGLTSPVGNVPAS